MLYGSRVAVFGELLEAPFRVVAGDVLDAAEPSIYADQRAVDLLFGQVGRHERCRVAFSRPHLDDEARFDDVQYASHELGLTHWLL